MQSDDPAFLLVGTEVSARFKGAFCEAKIKRLSKSVKCKVLLKEAPFSTMFLDHSQVQGILEVNQVVDVLTGKETVKGIIQHVKDNSTYTVVFNDGDERQLRRTQLCLKGAKHFEDSVNLDSMPLYNPEAFSSPVVTDFLKGSRGKTKRRKLSHRSLILRDEKRHKRSANRRQRIAESGSEESGYEQISSGEKEKRDKSEKVSRGWRFYRLRLRRNRLVARMSLVQTRKRRSAATAAAEALARGISYAKTDSEDEGIHSEEEGVYVRERGRPRKQGHIKDFSSGEDETVGMNKVNDFAKGLSKKRHKSNEDEEAPSKRLKNDEKIRKINYEPGHVVAVFDDVSRKGTWVPAVVVSSKAFTTFAKGNASLGKKEIPVRSFRDAKYFTVAYGSLMSFRTATLKNLDTAHRSAFERANGFAEKGTFPMNWERNHIYGDAFLGMKGRRESSTSINDGKKDALEEKKKEKPKALKNVPADTSSSEESSEEDEEYGEERDQFTAQLYKFHEERGTPINRAPILGGKDIDMFRLYNLVQAYGGKKKVIENNKWKKILSKLHLDGCPGANPRKVQNAYSRYLDHFNSFYKNLGVSSWLDSSTPSRSVRPIRLTDRDVDQYRRKKLAQLAEKKREKGRLKKEYKRDVKDEEAFGKAKEVNDKLKMKLKRLKERRKENFPREQKNKKEEKEIKKELESDLSSTSEVHFGSSTALQEVEKEVDVQVKVEDSKSQDEKIGIISPTQSEEAEQLGDLVDMSIEQDIFTTKEKQSPKGGHSPSEAEQRPEGEEVVEKKRSKQIGILKKMHRKKIHSESDANETYRGVTKRTSPCLVVSEPSTSTASIRLPSPSGSEDEGVGDQPVSRKGRKRKGSFREASAVSTTSCSSGHTIDSGGVRGSEVKPKKRSNRRKERDGVKTIRANVFTRFYQGQDVRVHHLAKWYDARVQTVDQPNDDEISDVLVEFEKKLKEELSNVTASKDGKNCDEKCSSASLWLFNRLEDLQKHVRCYVHYLGWNNRYDSWALLSDLKVAEIDQRKSENIFYSLVPEKFAAETLEKALRWRGNIVTSEVSPDIVSCGDRQESGKTSPFQLLVPQDADASYIGEEKEAGTRETSLNDENVVEGTDLFCSATREETLQSDGVPVEVVVQCSKHEASCPEVADVNIATNEYAVDAPISEVAVLQTLISSSSDVQQKAIEAKLITSDFKESMRLKETVTPKKTKHVSESKMVVDNVLCEAAFSKTDSLVPDMSEICREVYCSHAEVIIPLAIREAACLLAHARKSKRISRSAEEIKPEISAKNIVESHVLKIKEEFEVESSSMPFETPKVLQRDNSELETQDVLLETPMSSPSEVHWKQPFSNPASITNDFESISGEAVDVIDDEHSSPKDSFHALKLRLLQKMEIDFPSEEFDTGLGLDPIDEELAGEMLIHALQDRLQELKDVYHAVKAEQAHLDRRWRKTFEKRKQRKEASVHPE